ncbi:MAG: bifunctional aldolase/short-chain dehydrogenase [Cyclobacteriaceae bacterium]|nr:bifunctional aldolase/short-chain dehydrogenase [Cyclobacteriaceae bacterium]
MKNLWNESEAEKLNNDLLKLRVYTSRLLGQEEDLVLHGGGNTSVKIKETNIFGEEEEILYVKGSGWDLATIEAAGFAPVKQEMLLKMAELEEMNDPQMVRYQRMAMTNPSAPNPSVEAVLHAIIPFTFVDHTHADAVVTISNTPNGEQKIREIYGNKVIIVPYVMPGFILAREIYKMTRDINWNDYEGMILLNHGVFTFNHDPKKSYDMMIDIVSRAEKYLIEKGALDISGEELGTVEPLQVAKIRKQISAIRKTPTLARFDGSAPLKAFSELSNVADAGTRGPLTPDHIIRTKQAPVILSENFAEDIHAFVKEYENYFTENNTGDLVQLLPDPRWAIWPGKGRLSFGTSMKEVKIIEDISRHTIKAINQAEHLGGWTPLPEKDLFEMEYWVLEQEKLKKGSQPKSMQGKVALVTGGAGGIGKACVEALVEKGAVVAVLDLNPDIKGIFNRSEVLPIVCDVRDSEQLENAVSQTVTCFGGLDLVVSNAGIFPKSYSLDNMDPDTWDKSLSVNLTSHQRLLTICLPYLEMGIDPAIVIVGSKNVPAPGPGAAAYSVAKAGLTQLARVAALELGKKGIRINVVHPNAVYDTAIWTKEVLNARATHYGLSVEEYKTNNILRQEVTSADVANLTVELLGKTFSKTTGAQVPIDGGNDRVI